MWVGRGGGGFIGGVGGRVVCVCERVRERGGEREREREREGEREREHIPPYIHSHMDYPGHCIAVR